MSSQNSRKGVVKRRRGAASMKVPFIAGVGWLSVMVMAATAALVVWHVPAIFALGMQSETWHAIEQASFLATGLLFWWPVIQPFPGESAGPRWTILVYLFLATLPCDVLSGFLVFSERIAYPAYLCTPHGAGFSAFEDQQCAGALMWTCVTVVYLAAGTIIAIRLLSPPGDARTCNVDWPS